jgi:hypothetical protein
MAYEKFIHEVWVNNIEKQLQAKRVFVDGCSTEFDGLIKRKGDEVVMRSLGSPTVHKVLTSASYDKIAAPEKLADSELRVKVDQLAYFNVCISNIDEVQADLPLFDEFAGRCADALAEDEDKYAANLANDSSVTGIAVASLTAQNVYDYILDATQKLREQNVPHDAELEAIVTPAMATRIKKAKVLTDTDNSDILRNGGIGKIDGVLIKESNNVAKDTATNKMDMVMVRVRKKACAFVEQINKVIPYSPDDQLDTDALKGYVLYGAKVIRPKQMVVMKVTAYN